MTCSDTKCKPITCSDYFGDMVLSFNTIMTRIQASDNYDEVRLFCQYFDANKKRFPLVQLWFAQEFVADKFKKLNK